MKPFRQYLTVLFGCTLALVSCVDTSGENGFGLSDEIYDVAIPIINSKLTVARLADAAGKNTSIKIDPDGKTSVLYKGEVIRRSTAAIFPPFPGLAPYEITDTLTSIALQFNNTYLLKKSTFKDTRINFYFESSVMEDIEVIMRIPSLTKNGATFERKFLVKYNGSSPIAFRSEDISIDGWTLQSQTNSIVFHYEAKLPDGRKIRFDKAQMFFDLIKFSYIDGYLGYHVFAVDGSIIDVGLFNQWKSGTFDFENPKITISVDNAFGLPVRSRVNRMDLTTVTGKTLSLQSPFVNTGIDFAYPTFQEIGQIKTTNFDFNKNNSNLREIFNEKTKTIAYDISALVNPDRDTTIRGYITDGSFFVVNVAVEVPLHGSVNELVVSDTLDIDLSGISNVESAEIKALITNDFPAEMLVQGYFLDDNNAVSANLFEGDGIYIPGASLGPDGRTLPGRQQAYTISVAGPSFNTMKESKRMVLVGFLNTLGSERKESIWIYNDYGIDIKLGARVKYRK